MGVQNVSLWQSFAVKRQTLLSREKNATMYGKGVYFARDASYSFNYAPRDSAGIKKMFLCRVVHGEFCLGKKDALAPDVRDASQHLLYDSTVDNTTDPSIYVTYHDAQAYPEYLVHFAC